MHSRHSTARPRRERREEESTPTKSPVNGFPVSHMLGHNLNETKLEQTAGQTKLHWTGHRLGISLYEACGCRGGEFGGYTFMCANCLILTARIKQSVARLPPR